jgi:hypothetical protein
VAVAVSLDVDPLVLAGQPVQLGVEPSNCVITKLKIDKSRKRILERRNRSADGAKGKFSERDVMGDVD